MKASELSIEHLGILLIGDPGSGKSQFIGTMPKPLLVFNFDGKAGAQTYRRAKNADQIELMNLFDDNDQPTSVLDLEDTINKLIMTSKRDVAFPWASIALDSLTSYGDAEMKRAVYSNALSGTGGKRVGGIVPVQLDYLLQMTRIKFILGKLLSLPCNIAVAAHEAILVDKNGGVLGVVAQVSGKNTMAKNLPSMFGEAYHTEQVHDPVTKMTTWQIRCRGSEGLSWCFSKLGLPDIIQPNFSELVK